MNVPVLYRLSFSPSDLKTVTVNFFRIAHFRWLQSVVISNVETFNSISSCAARTRGTLSTLIKTVRDGYRHPFRASAMLYVHSIKKGIWGRGFASAMPFDGSRFVFHVCYSAAAIASHRFLE